VVIAKISLVFKKNMESKARKPTLLWIKSGYQKNTNSHKRTPVVMGHNVQENHKNKLRALLCMIGNNYNKKAWSCPFYYDRMLFNY
jgi:hypothetical protein